MGLSGFSRPERSFTSTWPASVSGLACSVVHDGFYATGLLAGLLLRQDKKILTNRHFYFAIGLGFLLFLPNYVWEARHGYPVVYHMKTLQNNQLQYLRS